MTIPKTHERFLRVSCLAWLVLAVGPVAVLRAAVVDFQRDIWPILQARCIKCHGPEKQRSSLRLDSRAALLKGGDAGVAIVVGEPKQSRLLELISSEDRDVRMPPDGEPLTADQIAKIRQWISEGAAWPADVKPAETGATHWAFLPVKRPAVPKVPDAQLNGNNPIDAFLAAKLSEHGLQMSPPATPRAFIRRVTLDLTGLPPTPEETAAFERDCESSGTTSPLPTSAVERLVDRLLASPRYGERWAQHWLDVIRYADTTGYEANDIRPAAWPYRDYVIAAFNNDVPYPQFILEQLAGDTQGVDPATGFLVTPPFPSRIEVGQEAAAVALARFNGLDEVLQNVTSAFLGLTVGCARCHDHKFDPVTTHDYYRMLATFAGLQFVDRPWRSGVLPTDLERAAEARLADIRRELSAFSPHRELEPIRGTDLFPPVRAKYVRIVVTDAVQKYPPAFDEIEVWTAGADGLPPRNAGAASQGAVARSSGAYAPLGSRDEFLNDERTGVTSQWIADSRDGQGKGFNKGEMWVEIELPQPMVINRVSWNCDFDEQSLDNVALRWRFVTDWTVEVAQEKGQWKTVISDDRNDGLSAAEQARRKRLEDQFAEAATRLWNVTHLFAGRFRSPPEAMHVLVRGDPQQRRDSIGPGGIDVLGSYELAPDTPETARRVELAKWLGSEQHPLTARVLVNRIWRHHFGAGLVDTPSDFGTQGERPSHPELLDWLSSEFMSRGWRLKELHRLICTSAAYRQSSRPNAAAAQLDSDTRWLWRFPPRRLEAEVIRDSMLAAAGSLDLTMGGPGVNIYKPRPKSSAPGEWVPLADPGSASFRRSIYLLRVRGADDGVFKPFDVPDCGQVRAKRTVSTTPLQALNLFNSPFVLDQAARLAARVERDAGTDRGRQIDRVFALTVGRVPDSQERKECLQVADQHGLAAVCRALFNSNEFLFLE